MSNRLKCILLFTIFAIFSIFGMKAEAASYDAVQVAAPGDVITQPPSGARERYLVSASEGVYYLYDAEGEEALFSSESCIDILSYSSYAEYCLDDIEIKEALVLSSGDYILSGSATAFDGIVIFGECIATLSRLDLELVGEGISIMGGSLTVENATIEAEDSVAIEVGYSYSSSLTITGGEICTSSDLPALSIKMGRAVIIGAGIKSEAGAGIYNLGSLFLSGNCEIIGKRYDIITEHPINLSYDGEELLGEIRLQYNGEFENGSMSEILRNCTEDSVSLVSVYDKRAREYELSFFESYNGVLERNFAAVYLPFSVRVFDGDTLRATYYYLKDEFPGSLVPPEKVGYVHRGFYLDEDFSEELSPSTLLTYDLDLYLKYDLIPPELSLHSMSFTYDASEHILSFSSLSHPLEDGGIFRLEWFYNGESLGNIDGGVSLFNVSDSGRYYCTVTFLYGKDSVSVTTPEVSVSILKKAVEIPTVLPKRYNGRLQLPDINSTLFYTVTADGGVDVGKYPVYISLTDSENYAFLGTEESEITLYFEIERSENRFLATPSILDTYANFPLNPSAYAEFGEVIFKYTDRIDGEYSLTPPSLPGEYYVIAEVYETENYQGIVSVPIPFNIIPERVTSLSVISPPNKSDYVAFEEFSPEGLVLELAYNSGRRESVDGNAVSIFYQSASSLRFGDNAVIAVYLGLSAVVPVSVARAEYDISSLSFPPLTVTYDGEFHTAALLGELPVGMDGLSLCARIDGGGSDVGVYTVYLEFTSDSKNYIIPEPITAVLTITPFEVAVVWGDREFIYDGKAKLPSAYFINELGSKITLTPSGVVTNATESAVATVTEPSDNYRFLNPTASFSVAKADFDLSGICWSAEKIVYCGTPVSVTLSGLPDGLQVIGYTDNTGTDVGNYLAKALFSFDTRNYNPPEIPHYNWDIIPCEYDISGIFFNDIEIVYDGYMHYPTLVGEMPIGLDGIALEYSFSAGALHASDEKYEVKLIFNTESKNYNVPEPMVAYVRVTAKRIRVIWEYGTAVYDGELHSPTAISDECDIVVTGGAVGAGKYTAYASAVSTDFEVINDCFDFEIKKAQNSFTALPEIESFYESEAPSPSGTAKEGEVIFEYFRDIECTIRAEIPLSFGVYYMRATAPESENYTELVYEPVEFEVKRVLPIGIEIALNKTTFAAYERVLPSDFVLTAVYNDGSRAEIPHTDIVIEYKSADSLRVKDESFTVRWGDLSLKCEVNVIRADYDLSGIKWENTEAVFDGEIKHPVLVGLPTGVSVKEYIGGDRYAGEYAVSAVLDYDTENYNPPEIAPCSFRITPSIVSIPELESAIYNGKAVTVRLNSDLYEAQAAEMINAGKYTVYLKLIDGKNYIFENGESVAVADFVIEKMPIEVKIEDLTVYLFEREGMPEYSLITEGYSEDTLALYYEVDGEFIHIYTANPNYEIIGNPARIIRSSRLSPEAREAVTLTLIILLLLILSILIFIKYKDCILDRIARARCKRNMERMDGMDSRGITEGKAPNVLEDLPVSTGMELIPLKCERDFMTVNQERADSLISDSLAKSLLRRERETVYTSGYKRGVVNVDTLSESFDAGEVINLNDMKKKRIVSQDTLSVKVLARGRIDKPLSVKANAFSLSAVKMIALSGGEAIRVSTKYDKRWREKNKDTIEKDTGV